MFYPKVFKTPIEVLRLGKNFFKASFPPFFFFLLHFLLLFHLDIRGGGDKSPPPNHILPNKGKQSSKLICI